MRRKSSRSARKLAPAVVGLVAFAVGGLLLSGPGGDSAAVSSTAGLVRDGLFDEQAVIATIDPIMSASRDLLLNQVYADQFKRHVRPCAAGLTVDDVRAARGLDAARLPSLPQRLRLTVPGIELPDAHAGDLSCTLADAGVWVLAVSDSGPGRVVLSMLAGAGVLLEVEVETPDGAGSGDLAVTAVSLVRNPDKRTALLLRPRPAEAADLTGRFTRVTEDLVAPQESLRVLTTLTGRDGVDLRAVGVTTPAQAEAAALARAAEPGCAEIGDCDVMPCGPMRRDNAVTRAALFPAADKAMICDRLAVWQTERHPPGEPDERLVRRALVLALQADLPETDITDGLARIVVEHTLAGTRMLITSELLPVLTTLPQLSQAVRDVSLIGCRGDDVRQTCDVKAELEVFSRSRNIPPGPQKELLEAVFGTLGLVERELRLEFGRDKARWILVEPADAVAALTDRSTGVLRKGPLDYFREGIEAMR